MVYRYVGTDAHATASPSSLATIVTVLANL